MEEQNKPVAPVEEKRVSEPTVVKSETTTEKKKGGMSPIVIILLVLVGLAILVCCAITIFFGGLASFLGDKGVQQQIQNQIKDEAKKQGVDTDVNLNQDTTKTQPIPAELPSDIKSAIPSYLGQPYNVNKAVQDNSGQYLMLFNVKGKTVDQLSSDFQSALKSQGFDVSKYDSSSESGDTTTLSASKTINGKRYGVGVSMQQQQGSSDVIVAFAVSY